MIKSSLKIVDFHGESLKVIPGSNRETTLVPMKQLCLNLGLAWTSQLAKIKGHPVLKSGVTMIVTPDSTGKNQATACLPLKLISGWLLSINSDKMKSKALADKVRLYQKECFDVLDNYVFGVDSSREIKKTELAFYESPVTHSDLTVYGDKLTTDIVNRVLEHSETMFKSMLNSSNLHGDLLNYLDQRTKESHESTLQSLEETLNITVSRANRRLKIHRATLNSLETRLTAAEKAQVSDFSRVKLCQVTVDKKLKELIQLNGRLTQELEASNRQIKSLTSRLTLLEKQMAELLKIKLTKLKVKKTGTK